MDYVSIEYHLESHYKKNYGYLLHQLGMYYQGRITDM